MRFLAVVALLISAMFVSGCKIAVGGFYEGEFPKLKQGCGDEIKAGDRLRTADGSTLREKCDSADGKCEKPPRMQYLNETDAVPKTMSPHESILNELSKQGLTTQFSEKETGDVYSFSVKDRWTAFVVPQAVNRPIVAAFFNAKPPADEHDLIYEELRLLAHAPRGSRLGDSFATTRKAEILQYTDPSRLESVRKIITWACAKASPSGPAPPARKPAMSQDACEEKTALVEKEAVPPEPQRAPILRISEVNPPTIESVVKQLKEILPPAPPSPYTDPRIGPDGVYRVK